VGRECGGERPARDVIECTLLYLRHVSYWGFGPIFGNRGGGMLDEIINPRYVGQR
jgi:hypothetical protein